MHSPAVQTCILCLGRGFVQSLCWLPASTSLAFVFGVGSRALVRMARVARASNTRLQRSLRSYTYRFHTMPRYWPSARCSHEPSPGLKGIQPQGCGVVSCCRLTQVDEQALFAVLVGLGEAGSVMGEGLGPVHGWQGLPFPLSTQQSAHFGSGEGGEGPLQSSGHLPLGVSGDADGDVVGGGSGGGLTSPPLLRWHAGPYHPGSHVQLLLFALHVPCGPHAGLHPPVLLPL